MKKFSELVESILGEASSPDKKRYNDQIKLLSIDNIKDHLKIVGKGKEPVLDLLQKDIDKNFNKLTGEDEGVLYDYLYKLAEQIVGSTPVKGKATPAQDSYWKLSEEEKDILNDLATFAANLAYENNF